jgi:hypothetical protein
MGSRGSDECRPWFLIFVPCLLWTFLPPWGDVAMMISFFLSQVR